MAYEYCIANSRVDKIGILGAEIEKYRIMIQEHYATRKRDEGGRMIALQQNNK